MSNGRILNIQRMSTEDGPGLRTSVFLKGCPLSCKWCHNPESISRQKELEFFAARCIGCGTCAAVCPSECITLSEDGLAIDRDTCAACMMCTKACPTTALEAKGKDISADELAEQLLKDKAYYEHGGGITLTGGEALLQGEFCADVLKIMKQHGIHTAIDTCGVCSRDALDACLPYTDLVLYDIKLADSDAHKQTTGSGNDEILDNASYIASVMKRLGKALWIRTPIIPDATDSEQNIAAIARWIADNIADAAERWELCAFNNLCAGKYERLGKTWQYQGVPLVTETRMTQLKSAAISEGVDADKVICTGATRTE